ncbi:single-stranded DNA-binding protein [bacterium]|nr:single-stranded DNA-binding protein [bacterium]
MLNQVVLVGRLVQDPEVLPLENGKKRASITLAVSRSFKNTNGEYETDFIRCVLWNGIAENTSEYCKKGDIVGVKGRLQTRTVESEDEKKKYYVEVVAEKVTFLSSKKTGE